MRQVIMLTTVTNQRDKKPVELFPILAKHDSLDSKMYISP